MTRKKNKAKVTLDSARHVIPLRINLRDPKKLPDPHPESSRVTHKTPSVESVAEEACRQLTLQLNTLPDAVIITTPDGTIADLNSSAALMLKEPVKNTLQRNIKNYLPGLSANQFKRIIQALSKACPVILEGMLETPSGDAIPADISVSLCGQENQELCFILRDIQHHQRTEEALNRMHGRVAKAERLEAAGMVSGQIAHDFNNLLTPLLAYPSLIRRELADGSPALEYLQVLEKTAEDMTHMTQQLLALSRRGNVGDEIFSLNDVSNHVLSLLRNDSMPNMIEIEADLADDLLPVRGGSDQMLRVIHNLCQNAIDAMGDLGGVLRIQTKNIYLEAPVGNYESVAPGEYVWMAIRDTGPGIPADIREKVFEPFFTTKRGNKRRGSGLGLSIVSGIVNDHHGYIDIESQNGDGTSFYLYLPVCRDLKTETTTESHMLGNGEKILVLDDDPGQLDIIIKLCNALNYQATGVSKGAEALDAVQAKPGAYDLAILDMRLDQQAKDGCDIWLAMKKISPDIVSLLTSGSGFPQPRVSEAQHHGAGPYVRKPLTLKKLGSAIRQALQTEQPDHETTAIGQAADQEAAPASAAPKVKRTAASSKRVLLVEDEERIRNVFAMVINEELPHVELDEAVNGAECLEKFKQTPCDVVIMDLYMPVKDGRQAFIELRDYCRNQRIPMPAVIFCTGFAVPEFLKKIVSDENEPHVLLLKPVRNADLIDAIRKRLPHS